MMHEMSKKKKMMIGIAVLLLVAIVCMAVQQIGMPSDFFISAFTEFFENYPEDDGYLIRGPSGRVVTTTFYEDNLEAYEKGDWKAIKKYFDENGIVGIEHNGPL